MAEDLVNKTEEERSKRALEEAVTSTMSHTLHLHHETITGDPNPEINKPTTPDVSPATNPVQTNCNLLPNLSLNHRCSASLY